MSTALKAIPYVSIRRLIKSNRNEYVIGIKLLDNDVWIELSKRYYSRDKAIEAMKKVITLINAFKIQVKWSVLDEKNKKETQSPDQNNKTGKIGNTERKKSISIADIPF